MNVRPAPEQHLCLFQKRYRAEAAWLLFGAANRDGEHHQVPTPIRAMAETANPPMADDSNPSAIRPLPRPVGTQGKIGRGPIPCILVVQEKRHRQHHLACWHPRRDGAMAIRRPGLGRGGSSRRRPPDEYLSHLGTDAPGAPLDTFDLARRNRQVTQWRSLSLIGRL